LEIIHSSKAVLSFRDGLVLGIPIMLTVILSFAPAEAMAVVPSLLRPIVGNGFVMGIIVVLVLEHLVLKETKNVKFGQFLQPGQTLVVSSKIVSETENETVVKAQGAIEGQVRIRAQLTLAKYNLADRSPHRACFDAKIVGRLKEELALLWPDMPNPLAD
jgi:3-hydroxymyristoyl/3-hydroxydecanoyl-(acyl carrier protein) dehydratase